MNEQAFHSTPEDSGREGQSCEREGCCCMIGTGSKLVLFAYAAIAFALLGLIAYGFLSVA
ncbi:MAG: hypothetical protein ACOC7M_01875 [Chloroflexota bacterium]